MQTLRKKTSPLKYKNETSRFLGEGVSFKAKLIGILEVSEARGDRMCQEALSDLKMAIRAAGEHKQRITINIAIDGLRLRDEKTGDSLYHHPVHKISFIAQDMTDSRAFGYIFGSPDTGHRFFGIKTDKAASQVVIAMRDLFQVVFALKKKEIELAKQHLDKNRYGTSSIFSDNTISSTKMLSQESSNKAALESKTGASHSETKTEGPAVADLVDLELELNSLQQGITQMERITPSDPFSSKDDPFGDSFTSYPAKPILPPPPSSRERSARVSESSSIFSPKTPHTLGNADASSGIDASTYSEREFNFSHEFNSSHDEPSSGDWFTPLSSDKIYEEPTLVPQPSLEQQQHELTKQEILSQFDVFMELDPLGMSTGKIKPYIDKKDFFQELKNPPKKVLNDLVGGKQPQESKLFNATFDQLASNTKSTNHTSGGGVYSADPFGEDPFDKTDPFTETDYSKQDPFDTENFSVDFKVFNKDIKMTETNHCPRLPKSPNKSLGLEKQMSLSTSPRTIQFGKQNTFDGKIGTKMAQVHENRSLDMSSESECAPEPPPRPTSGFVQIKPPPLPPKKQPGDLCSKPPPRPPYSDDAHYDYMDAYESGGTTVESIKKLDKSPKLPAPARKAKFESDFNSPPQRPKKHFNIQQSSEEDYLTPISFPKLEKNLKNATSGLLPPPQKTSKKNAMTKDKFTTSPNSNAKSNAEVTSGNDKSNSLEGLDITLSQLTLSGLNEVASKLDIPASQLSNMTLVQLTEYISNFIRAKSQSETNETRAQFANFANFNNFNEEPHDKYAVFRELLQEEIKQTKIDTEPKELLEERRKEEEEKISNLDIKMAKNEGKTDRYAALREIVENEINQTIHEEESVEENMNEAEIVDEQNNLNGETTNVETKLKNESNIIDTERKLLSDKEEALLSPKDEVIIEYNAKLESNKDCLSPPSIKSSTKIKSPIPDSVTDVIQSNNRLTSGSLSDVVSGSSPEVDNTGSTSEVAKKSTNPTSESWAIFDQPNLSHMPSRDKQSEEGVSPWSSDSKEFGNGSPPEWNQRPDSGNWARNGREQEGWWDTSAEPEAQYCPSNRRSTDSYEDECYDYYDRPTRRRRQATWTSHSVGGQAAGGHSSSSRDASPWEEEPRRREMRDGREHRETWASRHTRTHHMCERQRDRRHADSWDEEDDFEYDEEHSGRYHWPERHEKERHGGGMREPERWSEEWGDGRKHRRRRDVDRDRWCCPDWEQESAEPPPPSHYNVGRWRDRMHDERYYSRGSPQESPWDDDYKNEPEESHSRYVTKRNWKRPSSASEMDRKTGETKRQGQYHMGTGGSDGERDRRYKAARRSRSRDSQFTEQPPHTRHKIDPGLTLRNAHRSKQHVHQKSPIESEFSHDVPLKKMDNPKGDLNKRSATLGHRKKTKNSPTIEETVHTFPRQSSIFENNFIPSETESPISTSISPKFPYENDFETEVESPISLKIKGLRFENEGKHVKSTVRYESRKTTFQDESRPSHSSRTLQKSPFDDDFSPPLEKAEMQIHQNISKSSIKEEIDGIDEEDDSFTANNFDKNMMRKKILNKNRFSNSFHIDTNLKKSESVNIFARESDPFDDEFFSGHDLQNVDKSPKSDEHKWTDDFEDFEFDGEK